MMIPTWEIAERVASWMNSSTFEIPLKANTSPGATWPQRPASRSSIEASFMNRTLRAEPRTELEQNLMDKNVHMTASFTGFSAGRQATPAGRVGAFRDRTGACKRPEGDDGFRRCRVSRDDAFPARSLPGARRNGGRLRSVRRDQRHPGRAEAAAGRQPRHAAALQARVPGRRRRPPPQPGPPRRAGLRRLAVVLQHGAGARGRSDELRPGRRVAAPQLAVAAPRLRRPDTHRHARRARSPVRSFVWPPSRLAARWQLP